MVAVQHIEQPEQPQAERILREQVRPSPTNPRKRFRGIEELAETIGKYGQLSPVLVRPHPDGGGLYELVAGERRDRAIELLGWNFIDAVVRDLSDREVLKLQLVENGQREDVHPLEEAEAYDRLLRLDDGGDPVTPQQIADDVGKSLSYVHKRLKLLELVPAAREAFLDGKVSAANAVKIARIGVELQEQAVKQLLADGRDISTREIDGWLRTNVLLRIADAPFDTTSTELGGNGACGPCPHRTGSEPTLFDDMAEDHCTEPRCWREKVQAQWDHAVVAGQDRGLTAVDLTKGSGSAPSLYLVTDNGPVAGAAEGVTVLSALEAAGIKPVAVVRTAEGKIVDGYKLAEALEAFKRASSAPATATDEGAEDDDEDAPSSRPAPKTTPSSIAKPPPPSEPIDARQRRAEEQRRETNVFEQAVVKLVREEPTARMFLAARIIAADESMNEAYNAGGPPRFDVSDDDETFGAWDALAWVRGLSEEQALDALIKLTFKGGAQDAYSTAGAAKILEQLRSCTANARAQAQREPEAEVDPRARSSQGEVLLSRAAKGKATKATTAPKPSPKSKGGPRGRAAVQESSTPKPAPKSSPKAKAKPAPKAKPKPAAKAKAKPAAKAKGKVKR